MRKVYLIIGLLIILMSNIALAQSVEDKGFIINAPLVVTCTDCVIPITITNNNPTSESINLLTRFEEKARYKINKVESNTKKSLKYENQNIKKSKKEEKYSGITLSSGETLEYDIYISVEPQQFLKYDIEIETSKGIVTLDPYIDTQHLLENDDFNDNTVNTDMWNSWYNFVGVNRSGAFYWGENLYSMYFGCNDLDIGNEFHDFRIYHTDLYNNSVDIWNITLNFSAQAYTIDHSGSSYYLLGINSSLSSSTLIQGISTNPASNSSGDYEAQIIINYQDLTLNTWINGTQVTEDEEIREDEVFSLFGQVYISDGSEVQAGVNISFHNYTATSIDLTYTPTPNGYFPLNLLNSTNHTPNNISYNHDPTPDGLVNGDFSHVNTPYNKGIYMSGDSNIEIDNETGYSTLCDDYGCSLEIYVNTTDVLGNYSLISRYNETDNDRFFTLEQIEDQYYRFRVYADGGSSEYCEVSSSSEPKINNYTNIIGTYDNINNNCKIYIDGILESISDESLNLSGWGDIEPTYIGYNYNGTIDFARLYDRPLASYEIIDHAELGEDMIEKYLNLTILDEKTLEPILDDLLINIISNNGDYAQSTITNSGYFNSFPLPVDDITVSISGDNYPQRVFTFAVSNETITKTVLMLNTSLSQATKFIIRDSNTNAVRDAYIQLFKEVIIGTETFQIPVTSKMSDYLGAIGVVLDIDTIYYINVSKSGFRTISDTQEIYSPYEYLYTLYETQPYSELYLNGIYATFYPKNSTIYADYSIINGSNVLNNSLRFMAISNTSNIQYVYIRFDGDTNSNPTLAEIETDLYPYINTSISVQYEVKRTDRDDYHTFNRTYYVTDNQTTDKNYLVGVFKNLVPELDGGTRMAIAIFVSLIIVIIFATVRVPVPFLPIPFFATLLFFALAEWITWGFVSLWGAIIILGYILGSGVRR